jgi:hypothetical protein
MSNNSGVIARCACESTSVTQLLFYIAYDCTFRTLTDWENVADCKGGFPPAVNEGAGVEAFGGDEGFFAEFITVRITEDDTGKGCTTVNSD